MTKTIPILTVHFPIPLQSWEIVRFRGAVSEWVMRHKKEVLTEEEKSVFHNHLSASDKKKVHYRYPLIQYRSHRQKASIVAIGDACQTLQKILVDCSPEFNLSGKPFSFQWTQMYHRMHRLERTEKDYSYALDNWIALNDTNFKAWRQKLSLHERIEKLEKLIVGHILVFSSAMNWQIPKRFDIRLLVLKGWKEVTLHRTQMHAFQVEFAAPLRLPTEVGIGKGVSHGFGILKKG